MSNNGEKCSVAVIAVPGVLRCAEVCWVCVESGGGHECEYQVCTEVC